MENQTQSQQPQKAEEAIQLDEALVEKYCMYIRYFLGINNGMKPWRFAELLVQSIFVATVEETEKLRLGFPEAVEAYYRYMSGKTCNNENCHCEE